MDITNHHISLWGRLTQNPLTITGLSIVGGLCIVALFAPWLAPYNPQTIDTWHILEAPSGNHFLGTDSLGRDCLSRLIYGARISLLVGIIAVTRYGYWHFAGGDSWILWQLDRHYDNGGNF